MHLDDPFLFPGTRERQNVPGVAIMALCLHLRWEAQEEKITKKHRNIIYHSKGAQKINVMLTTEWDDTTIIFGF